MILNGQDKTEALGRYLGERVKAYDILALIGDLGAGKTTFVKALAEGMGFHGDVTSATFAIVNIYKGDPPLYHFDAYRLRDEEDFFQVGGEDLLGDAAVSAIEWANLIEESLPENYLVLEFRRIDETTREITAKGVGPRGKELEQEVAKYEDTRL